MKIAVEALKDIFEDDGLSLRVRRVVKVLYKKHQPTVITASDHNELKLEGITNNPSVRIIAVRGITKYLGRWGSIIIKLLFGMLWELKLTMILLTNKFDVVYCVHDIYGFPGAYAISKIKKYRIIFEAHEIFSEKTRLQRNSGMRLKIDGLLARFAARHSDAIIALSKDIQEYFEMYSQRTYLVPDFFDDSLFEVIPKPENKPLKTIGLIGPFDDTPRKQAPLEFLYTNIDRFDSKIKFVIIGRCIRKIDNPRITYTGYLPSRRDYIDLLSRLDAVMVLDRIATFGLLNRIVEPMSCSIPVFTTPVNMTGFHNVEPGKDILVFEENNLPEEINKLIPDEELMTTIGKHGKDAIVKYYSQEINEKKLIKIIESTAIPGQSLRTED